MTKTKFMDFLESSFGFLTHDEKKSALEFFEKKFSDCSSAEEETALINSFGDPEKSLENFRKEYRTMKKANSNVDLISCLSAFHSDSASISKENQENQKEKKGNGDVIFSKPIHIEKASKIIHSFEDRLIKPLFGKRVSIKENTDPVEEIILEPIDRENGLTPEEIQNAKAETLQKANKFSSQEEPAAPSNIERDHAPSGRILLEEDEDEPAEAENVPLREFSGLFNQFVPQDKYDKWTRIGLLALLTIAVSPLILFVFGLLIFAYGVVVAFTLFAAGILFAIMVALIAIGVIELVHGFLLLFDSVPAALIELGFGTILFSFVVAIGAFIYELIFGVVPKWLKWITSIFIRYTKLLFCYLYGGKA